jgi:hypothetical protein
MILHLRSAGVTERDLVAIDHPGLGPPRFRVAPIKIIGVLRTAAIVITLLRGLR